MEEKLIGRITHYYGHLGVGIIELSDTLKVGDSIHIKGHESDFVQQVSSMQIERASVEEAGAGEVVGIKVEGKVHEHDSVYKA
jgi:putative protease